MNNESFMKLKNKSESYEFKKLDLKEIANLIYNNKIFTTLSLTDGEEAKTLLLNLFPSTVRLDHVSFNQICKHKKTMVIGDYSSLKERFMNDEDVLPYFQNIHFYNLKDTKKIIKHYKNIQSKSPIYKIEMKEKSLFSNRDKINKELMIYISKCRAKKIEPSGDKIRMMSAKSESYQKQINEMRENVSIPNA
jgi:hypothetical protein